MKLTPSLKALIERGLTPREWAKVSDAEVGAPDDETRRLLARWRKIVCGRSQGNPGAFEKRLTQLGLTAEQAENLLLPRKLGDKSRLPEWVRMLKLALAPASWSTAAIPFDALQQFPAQELEAYDIGSGQCPTFPEWLHPFVNLALAEAGARLQAQFDVFLPDAVHAVARMVLVRLSRIASRTLVYESRRGNQARVEHSDFVGLLRRYPALARLLAVSTENTVEAAVELVQRLNADLALIQEYFVAGQSIGRVNQFIGLRSDAHNRGRTVVFLGFECGLQLVYKPRSHALDLAFQAFVQSLHRAGSPEIRLPKLLARDGYGWSQRLHAQDCEDESAALRYFERQGALAAVFYFLCGKDFHYENFIPHAEWPIPVDLEALMALAHYDRAPDTQELPRHLIPAGSSTVLATSMGSYWRRGQDEQALFVASGIGGCGQRMWPQPVPFWEIREGKRRLAWRPRRYEYLANLPRVAGQPRRPDQAAVRAVATGFRAAYALVRSQRAALLAGNGALERFRGAHARAILRDTADYASVLFWSSAPDQLVTGRAFYVALESLVGEVPQFAALDPGMVLSEDRDCCLDFDIPVWYSRCDGTRLIAPSGQHTAAVAPSDALTEARARIAGAGDEDEIYQCELLCASLKAALLPARTPTSIGEEISTPPNAGAAWATYSGWGALARSQSIDVRDLPDSELELSKRLLSSARSFGETLADMAMRLSKGNAWLGLSRTANSDSEITPMVAFPWTAAGAAGAAVLFANLHRVFEDARFESQARAALALCEHTVDRMMARGWWERVHISAYNGSSFLIYAFTECGRLLGQPAYIEQAMRFLRGLAPERLAAQPNPDWLNGTAGVAAVIARLHAINPEVLLRDRALTIIENLCRANPRSGFEVPGFPRPLLGMAHGAAGIAAGCANLLRMTDDDRLEGIITGALEFERQHFDADCNDWPDLRREGPDRRFMSGWCAGPAGAGLARLIVRNILPSSGLDAEIAHATNNTRERLGIDRHHLCCGEAGRIIYLAAAGRQLNDRGLRLGALRAAASLAAFYDQHHYFRFQEFSDVAWIPGLLDGAGGIILAMLAAASPDIVSNPLALG